VRAAHVLAGLSVLAAGITALDTTPAFAFRRGFHRHPYFPGSCSVFDYYPCIPYGDFWIGQDLRLTIESKDTGEGGASVVANEGAGKDDAGKNDAGKNDAGKNDAPAGAHKLHTIRAMFDALRACWIPPPQDEARPGMQMSVRFAFKRSGDIIAAPRVTYVSPGASPETREVYLHAITAALARCTPLPLSDGLGGSIAGRPIAIRFVDNRVQP
jgi:hypothetical protein